MSGFAIDRDGEVPTGFVPRSQEVSDNAKVINEIRQMERERKLRRLVTVAGGWVFGGCMTVVAASAVALMVHRPVPHDRLIATFNRADGAYEAPVMVEDLPKARSDILLKYSLIQYINAMESYSWEASNRNYNLVSAMSDKPLQTQFQAIRNDKKNPENPFVIYGNGPGAMKVDVIATKINLDDQSPNAPTAQIKLMITTPGRPDRTLIKTASIIWAPPPAGGWETDKDPIPPEIQQQFDPMGITITHYKSVVDLPQ